MSFQVVVADRAAAELKAAARWWAENRSIEQAERWYTEFVEAIASLHDNPQRCAVARESDLFAIELRQLNFSVAGRPTHRAVFTIQGSSVIVLAVRHQAQSDLSSGDLT